VTSTHFKILIVRRSRELRTAELPHFQIPVITISATGNIPITEHFALGNFQCYLSMHQDSLLLRIMHHFECWGSGSEFSSTSQAGCT